MNALAAQKEACRALAATLANGARGGERAFFGAVARSCSLTAEDIYREAGYMLPQSGNVHKLLLSIAAGKDEKAAALADRLLALLPVNDR